ncbi:hypothetical protein [Ornithinimicrobium pratense]|uniref:hypothetical protein n=1 Tax=Ornithinimicrobium pratense TaxID=2593973 RepID=UPI001787A35E|nr:hypothetical protein [Ornithinimicrobium pratense]
MRSVIAAVLALGLVGGLGSCGPAEQPEPTGAETGTDGSTSSPNPATTNEETSMSEQQMRQAAEAEQPVTETKLREVAALLHPDLDQLQTERPRWIGGGTAACTWDRSALSYIARGSVPAAESPEAAAQDAIAQLPDTWTANEGASTGGHGRYFEDPDGYLLMVSWQSDPDFVLLSVESPCHG